MMDNQYIPDFSGDDLANDKEVQKARAKRRAYENLIQESLSVIRQEVKAQDASHIDLKGFHMFKPLTATVKHSLKSVVNYKNLHISLAEYHSAFPTARDSNSGSDQYIFGHMSFRTRCPRTYIHKETLKDKIEDVFLKRDIDFIHSKAFSRKFQVMTEDNNTLERIFQSKKLDDLIDFRDMELEFFNNVLLFRSSRKPVSVEEAKIFCDLTKALSSIFD